MSRRRSPGEALLRRALGLAWRGPDDDELRAAVSGRTVLITGASSGIGEATALRLGAAGAHLLLVARRVELLEKVAAAVVEAGGSAAVYPADLSDPEQIEDLLHRLPSGREIDIVVNNAGKSIRRPLDQSYDRFHDFTRTTDINYLGPVRLLLGLLPGMRERGSGHLINISTVGVDAPTPYWSAYAASKAAFEWWLWSVAPEAGADGVASTSIHFGLVHTAMSAPSAVFQGKPGMSPREAGDAVCRAVVERPRVMRPRWAQFAALSGTIAPGTATTMMTLSVRRDRRVQARAARRARRRTG